MSDTLQTMQAMGLSLPSPAYIFGAIVFGLVGMGAWRWGRLREHPRSRWIGVALMLYPYVVPNTWLLYLVGLGLCLALYLGRPH